MSNRIFGRDEEVSVLVELIILSFNGAHHFFCLITKYLKLLSCWLIFSHVLLIGHENLLGLVEPIRRILTKSYLKSVRRCIVPRLFIRVLTRPISKRLHSILIKQKCSRLPTRITNRARHRLIIGMKISPILPGSHWSLLPNPDSKIISSFI